MKSTARYLIKAVLTLIAAFTLFASHSRAAVIYNDTFDRTGVLSGSTPAPTDATGAVWMDNAGASGYSTNGSTLVLDGNTDLIGLSFDLTNPAYANSIVSLSADISMGTSGGQWVGLGFCNGSSVWSGAYSWMILWGGNANAGLNAGVGLTSDTTVNSAFTPGTTVAARIDYNTATNLASYYANNTLLGTLNLTSTPTTDRVMIYSNAATGSIDNFMVSVVAIPEPSTLGQLAAGMLILTTMFRRRRK